MAARDIPSTAVVCATPSALTHPGGNIVVRDDDDDDDDDDDEGDDPK
jgi:hypothetical protein